MSTMHLHPQPALRAERRVTRSCQIRREGDGDGVQPAVLTLWFDVDDHPALPSDDDADVFLIAMLMEAMREGRALHVHGTVSGELLGNLREFQEVWARWRPTWYRRVPISVDRIDASVPPPSPGAVCAFSGGVDASFSVWRHSGERRGHRSPAVTLCVLVHGFDIPLDDTDAYALAFERAAASLTELSLPLKAVRTNFRQIAAVHWEDNFAAALVAALGNFKGQAGTCLFGSAKPYDALVLPSGSSPIGDHLLGSSAFRVVHDGASHCRTGKVRELAAWRTGADNLRVCWEGAGKGRNCGRCEKCLRTMVNFLAAGLPVPRAFPRRRSGPRRSAASTCAAPWCGPSGSRSRHSPAHGCPPRHGSCPCSASWPGTRRARPSGNS